MTSTKVIYKSQPQSKRKNISAHIEIDEADSGIMGALLKDTRTKFKDTVFKGEKC
jgi:hypothetical protein